MAPSRAASTSCWPAPERGSQKMKRPPEGRTPAAASLRLLAEAQGAIRSGRIRRAPRTRGRLQPGAVRRRRPAEPPGRAAVGYVEMGLGGEGRGTRGRPRSHTHSSLAGSAPAGPGSNRPRICNRKRYADRMPTMRNIGSQCSQRVTERCDGLPQAHAAAQRTADVQTDATNLVSLADGSAHSQRVRTTTSAAASRRYRSNRRLPGSQS